jgi:hypothetical protein
MLQPPWLSAHFRLSIGSHLRLPLAPPPLQLRHRAVHCRLPPSSVREEPNRSAVMPPSLPPLNRHCPISSSTFNSFETDEESNSTAVGRLPSSPPLPRPYKMHPRLCLSAPHSLLPSFALLRIPSHPTLSTTTAVSPSSPPASLRHCPGHQSPR